MGLALATRLRVDGWPLAIHDLRADACTAIASADVEVCATARGVADVAEVVFVCLPSIEAGREVVRELAGGSRRKVVVETLTIGPRAIRENAALLAMHGVAVVDAPVSGGPLAAASGKLALMHSGAPEHLALVQAPLEAMAARRFDVGPDPGLAQVCKLVNNAISAAGMLAACEAMVVGVKAGLDAATLPDAVNAGSGRNAATLDKFPSAVLPGTFDWGCPLGLMLKDLGAYLELAGDCGVQSAVVDAALRAWQEAVHRDGFDSDLRCAIRHLEIDAGVEVRHVRAASSTSQAERSR